MLTICLVICIYSICHLLTDIWSTCTRTSARSANSARLRNCRLPSRVTAGRDAGAATVHILRWSNEVHCPTCHRPIPHRCRRSAWWQVADPPWMATPITIIIIPHIHSHMANPWEQVCNTGRCHACVLLALSASLHPSFPSPCSALFYFFYFSSLFTFPTFSSASSFFISPSFFFSCSQYLFQCLFPFTFLLLHPFFLLLYCPSFPLSFLFSSSLSLSSTFFFL